MSEWLYSALVYGLGFIAGYCVAGALQFRKERHKIEAEIKRKYRP